MTIELTDEEGRVVLGCKVMPMTGIIANEITRCHDNIRRPSQDSAIATAECVLTNDSKEREWNKDRIEYLGDLLLTIGRTNEQGN